jgi:hypothetical protein
MTDDLRSAVARVRCLKRWRPDENDPVVQQAQRELDFARIATHLSRELATSQLNQDQRERLAKIARSA